MNIKQYIASLLACSLMVSSIGPVYAVTDTTSPVLSSVTANGILLTITYNEPLDTTSVPLTSALQVKVNDSIRSVKTVNISGSIVQITLSSTVKKTNTISLSYTKGNKPIQDIAGNDVASFASTTVTNLTGDTILPTVQSIAANGPTLTIVYDEKLDTTSIPAVSNFTVSVGESTKSVSNVAVDGQSVVLTIDPVNFGESATISYTPNGVPIQDIAGNDAVAFSEIKVSNNTSDTVGPVFGSALVDQETLTIAYDETLDTLSIPAASDFTLSGGHTVTSAAVSGSTVVLVMTPAATIGESITLSYAGGSTPIQDVSGNDAVQFVDVVVTNTTVDTTPPTPVSIVIKDDTLTMAMSEPLDEKIIPSNAQLKEMFIVTADATPKALKSVRISSNQITVTLDEPVMAGQIVDIGYVPTSQDMIQDTAGNDMGLGVALAVTNTTPEAPRVPKWSRYIYLDGQKVATVEDKIDGTKKIIVHLTDHLGGSNIDTDTDGNILQITDYMPFGSERIVLEKTADYQNKYRFIGKERDKESDLLYVEARYYDSDLGRFISQDPVFWEIGITSRGKQALFDSQTFNAYSYSRNNPITYSDKNGEYFDTLVDAAVGIYDIVQAAAGLTVAGGGAIIEGAGYVFGSESVQDAGQKLREGAWGYAKQESLDVVIDLGAVATPGLIAPVAKTAITPLVKLGTKYGDQAATGIKNIEKRLGHVYDRHGADKLADSTRSVFNNSDEIKGLIESSASVSTTVQSGGNLQRIVNAGRDIGIDRTTGKQTQWYTVITDKSNNLVTAFPGKP